MRNKEQIDLIMKDFDFKKVGIYMTVLGIMWTMEDGAKPKVPTIGEIKVAAKFCLNKVTDSNCKNDNFAMGGFEADKIDGILELRFVIDRVNPLKHIVGL